MKKYLYLSLFFLANTVFSALNASLNKSAIKKLKNKITNLERKNTTLTENCANLETENNRLLWRDIVSQHITQEFFVEKKDLRSKFFAFYQKRYDQLKADCEQPSTKKRRKNVTISTSSSSTASSIIK